MRTHPNRIVVGVDGSADAMPAVRWAAAEARRRHAALPLVAALVRAEDRLPGAPGLGRTYAGDRLRAATERSLTTAAEAAPGVPTEREVITGFAADVLVAESRTAE